MARPRYPNSSGPLPPPLPPVTRTIGQLVAETVKAYGEHWKAALLIGLPPAFLSAGATGFTRTQTLAIVPFAGGIATTASYVLASAVVGGVSMRSRRVVPAAIAGILVYLPFPFLAALFVLPGLAWFALVGLAVPAAMREDLGVRAALRRGVELGRADFSHAFFGLVTLTLVVFLTQIAAAMLLQGFADNSERAAAFLAGLVLSPVLFIGAALLYVDQAARVGTTRAERLALRVAPHDSAQ
jgi:hypothetical protein